MQRRRFLAAAGAALAIAPAAGCAGGSGGSGSGGGAGGGAVVETTDVAMEGFQFHPRNIRVAPGATVTWTNDDGSGHTVTSASDNWSLDVIVEAGQTTTHAFDAAGVYDVYCKFHGRADLSGMSMKVAVGDATIAEPLGTPGSSQSGAYG